MALGGFPPRAPTDPDVRISRIRLVRVTGSLRKAGANVAPLSARYLRRHYDVNVDERRTDYGLTSFRVDGGAQIPLVGRGPHYSITF